MAASKPHHRVQAIKQNWTFEALSLVGAKAKIGEEGAFALLEAGSTVVHAASSQPPQKLFPKPETLLFPASLERRPAGSPNKRGGAAVRSEGLRLGRFGQGDPRGTGQGPPDRPGGVTRASGVGFFQLFLAQLPLFSGCRCGRLFSSGEGHRHPPNGGVSVHVGGSRALFEAWQVLHHIGPDRLKSTAGFLGAKCLPKKPGKRNPSNYHPPDRRPGI